MSKKKKRKGEKKRNLKYGNITLAKEKNIPSENKVEAKGETTSKETTIFKKELKNNLLFTGSFLAVLLIFYFIITRTSALNLILEMLGLGGLYN